MGTLDRKYVTVLTLLIFLLSFHLLPKVKERLFFFAIGKTYSSYEWKNVTTIREWVSTHTPSSSDSLLIQNTLWRNSPYEIYLKFFLNRGGVNCAGYSYALMKLYKEFGYRAFSYHSGHMDKFNHVITLVEINYKGSRRLVIQDATFDATYMDDNMEPYDFFTFLDTLEKKKYGSIHIMQSDSPPHIYICDLMKRNSCRIDSKKEGPVHTTKDRQTYREKLGSNTIENNKEIYLYPRLVQTDTDGVAPLNSIHELRGFLKKSL